MKTKSKGFTLIELMIVVAIIGILASIAMPAYQDYTMRAQISEALTLVGEVKADIREYYKYNGSFPKDNTAAGVPAPKHLIGNYVKQVTVRDGAVHVELGNRANSQLYGKTISIRPLVVKGSPESPISWGCGHAAPPKGMRAMGENRTDVADRILPAPCR